MNKKLQDLILTETEPLTTGDSKAYIVSEQVAEENGRDVFMKFLWEHKLCAAHNPMNEFYLIARNRNRGGIYCKNYLEAHGIAVTDDTLLNYERPKLYAFMENGTEVRREMLPSDVENHLKTLQTTPTQAIL